MMLDLLVKGAKLPIMLKTDALELWNGRQTDMAAAVGVTKQAISLWPDELPPRIADRVIAAAVRGGKSIPPHFLKREQAAA